MVEKLMLEGFRPKNFMVEVFMVEKFMIEKFMVELSAVVKLFSLMGCKVQS